MTIDAHGNPVFQVRRNGKSHAIGIPVEVGNLLVGQSFVWRWTEDGFSYTLLAEAPKEGLPQWVRELQE